MQCGPSSGHTRPNETRWLLRRIDALSSTATISGRHDVASMYNLRRRHYVPEWLFQLLARGPLGDLVGIRYPTISLSIEGLDEFFGAIDKLQNEYRDDQIMARHERG
jgi:hypothetical protein